MKNKLFTTLVAILVLFSIGNFYLSFTNAQKSSDLSNEISQLPKTTNDPVSVIYKQGIDGKPGVNGTNGVNAISFSSTVIKEVPTIQQITNNLPSPKLIQQFDDTTGNFVQKYEGESFFSVVIPCDKFVNGCVSSTPISANQPSGDLDSF